MSLPPNERNESFQTGTDPAISGLVHMLVVVIMVMTVIMDLFSTVVTSGIVIVIVAMRMAISFGTSVRVTMVILPDSEADEQNASHDTDRSTDLDRIEYRNRFVYLCQIEVAFRVKEHADHCNTTDEMADPDDETRRKSVHPLVRLVERVGSRDWPAMPRFNSVHSPECNRPDHQTK